MKLSNHIHFPFKPKKYADIVSTESPYKTYPAWEFYNLMKPYQVWHYPTAPMVWNYLYLGAIPEVNLKFENIHDAVWGHEGMTPDWIQNELSAQGVQDGAWMPKKSGEITLVSTDWRRPKRTSARPIPKSQVKRWEHGADRIPAEELDKVKDLLRLGNKEEASKLLSALAVQYRLLSYEVHHLAAKLLADTEVIDVNLKTADILSKVNEPFEVGERIVATDYIQLTMLLGVVEGTHGTIQSLRRKEALVKFDVFRNQWWVPLTSITKDSSHQSSQSSLITFADIIGQETIVKPSPWVGARVWLANVNFDLSLPPHSKGTITKIVDTKTWNFDHDIAFVTWDDKPQSGALAIDTRKIEVLPEQHTAAEAQPAVEPTASAPQQKLIANSMGDFANMVSANQVWQSQSGNFLHLQPNFAVTAKDNNRIVMTGIQWRTADNQQLTPSQPNTLIASDFPFTLRRDLMAVTGDLKFADVLGLPEPELPYQPPFEIGDEVDVDPLPDDPFNEFRGHISGTVDRAWYAFYQVTDMDGNTWDVEEQQMTKVTSLNTTAARPTHQGEYTWEQFKRMARAGQVWQTSNALIRIDRLLENAPTRRQSRFIRFKGAWTGIGPRAVRALMPQKNGKFLNSTAPWLISRMYSPFLLIREGVFEGLSEGVTQSMPPAEDNAQPEASTPMSGKPQVYPELELEGGDGQEHRQGVYVGVHVKFSDRSGVGPSLQRKQLEKYKADYGQYSIPYRSRPIPTRPKGRPRKVTDVGSRVEALEDIIISTGLKPVIIPKGTTGAAVQDEGESVYVVWNDVAESFGTVEKSKVKYSVELVAPEPELESLAMLKFSDIVGTPEMFGKVKKIVKYEQLPSELHFGQVWVCNNPYEGGAVALVIKDPALFKDRRTGQTLQPSPKHFGIDSAAVVTHAEILASDPDNLQALWLHSKGTPTVIEKSWEPFYLMTDDFTTTASIKFSDIVSQPSQVDSAKTQANAAYQNLAGFLQNGHFHETDDQLAFNIKYYRVNIPENVRETLNDDQIQAHIDDQTRMELDSFVDDLKGTYPWITDYEISGRSGGWLQLHVDMSQFGQPYAETVWEVLWQRESDLESTVELMVEQEEEPEFRIWTGLAYAAEAMDRAFDEIDTKVQIAKKAFMQQLESEEFWAPYL